MDSTEKLLHAIEEVRDEARADREESRAHRAQTDARLDIHEQKIAQHNTALQTIGTEVAAHTAQLAKLADSQVSVAKSASMAAEIATRALSMSSTAQDDNRKMVESAMSIQGGAISQSVKDALGPVVAKIGALEKNDQAQNEQFALIVGMLGKLARWQDHWAVKAGVVIAGLIGAGVAGYLGAHH